MEIPVGTHRKMMRSEIEAERAKKLAERFALYIEPLSPVPDKETTRIEKPVRMRIHRTCHICSTTYGGNKTCVKCEHVRCKSCPRYPVKKTEKKEKALAPTTHIVTIEPDTYWGLREPILLTRPSGKPGAQPLVRKRPKQRVRRNCHECHGLFPSGTKICPGCDHVRCVECPRDP